MPDNGGQIPDRQWLHEIRLDPQCFGFFCGHDVTESRAKNNGKLGTNTQEFSGQRFTRQARHRLVGND